MNMLDWVLRVMKSLDQIREKAEQAHRYLDDGDKAKAELVNKYLKQDIAALEEVWGIHRSDGELSHLRRHVNFGEKHDYLDIVGNDLGKVGTLMLTTATKSSASLKDPKPHPYVAIERIDSLRKLPRTRLDSSRLVAMCQELNAAYQDDAYLSMGMLQRAIIDHVPPAFGATTFATAIAGHGGKSYKTAMQRLDKALRDIADLHLHSQMTRREVMPGLTQVHFAAELDLLLSEVVKILDI